MMQETQELLRQLQARGWTVRTASHPGDPLPADVRARYDNVPAEVLAFLGSLDTCHNLSETVWFLTRATFDVTDEGFRWNEYELMSLDSARVLRDPDAETARVRAFWDAHFVFMKAVHSDYDYLAVRLRGPDRGAIVHGFAPEWEEPEVIAPSFSAMITKFTHEAALPEPGWPYDVFLADPGTTEPGSARIARTPRASKKPWWRFW